MNKEAFEIRSVVRKTYISGPITFWFFSSFVTLCFLVPGKEKEPYPFEQLFTLMFYYLIFFILAGFILYWRRELIVISSTNIQHLTARGKLISEYNLSDIVDFEWSNKSMSAGTGHMYSVQLNNDYAIVAFKDETELTITRQEFENFEEIRNYLFNYCVKNKIIHIRPLSERR